jgi:PAS domain-containing protein
MDAAPICRSRLRMVAARAAGASHSDHGREERELVVRPTGTEGDVTGDLLGFIERTSDLVGVVDGESRVVYLNDAARKRLGIGDWTGMTSSDLFAPESFARYYDEVRPALLHDGVWHGELAMLSAGESVLVAMSIVAKVGPGGEVQGLVAAPRELETPRVAVLSRTGCASRSPTPHVTGGAGSRSSSPTSTA